MRGGTVYCRRKAQPIASPDMVVFDAISKEVKQSMKSKSAGSTGAQHLPQFVPPVSCLDSKWELVVNYEKATLHHSLN